MSGARNGTCPGLGMTLDRGLEWHGSKPFFNNLASRKLDGRSARTNLPLSSLRRLLKNVLEPCHSEPRPPCHSEPRSPCHSEPRSSVIPSLGQVSFRAPIVCHSERSEESCPARGKRESRSAPGINGNHALKARHFEIPRRPSAPRNDRSRGLSNNLLKPLLLNPA